MFTTKEAFKQAYQEKIVELTGVPLEEGTTWDHYHALTVLLKEKISLHFAQSNKICTDAKKKQVYYFSMEFLIGKLLPYYLIMLGIKEVVETGLKELGIELDHLVKEESDAGLGNGGLGRLAACFLDSMAFLGVPGHGNGIRYKYGLFQQKLIDGFQAEVPDNWLKNGYPWETRKPDKSVVVKFKGHVRSEIQNERLAFIHENYDPVLAVPYDIPIVGLDNLEQINNLRLWSAEPLVEEFDLASFNRGEYSQAVSYRAEVEAISYILYPEDSSEAGRELRLKQEYFFVAAGLGAIVRRYKKKNGSFAKFSERIVIHINDTHPALCIPELMRIFLDEEKMDWEQAWNIVVNSVSYTNHTIMPEALEKWPLDLCRYLLPRVCMIIEEIDRRYKEEIYRKFPGQRGQEILNHSAIVKDGYVQMANLAVIGSFSVNGVAALHTNILKDVVFRDFQTVYPYKFNNKTNGVSHRRFLMEANPGLSQLLTDTIGDSWQKNAVDLEKLLAYKDDRALHEQLARVKYENKQRLAAHILANQGIQVDPSSVFDIQVKRIHAYKRQLLHVFKILDLYNRTKENPQLPIPPFTFIFGGKAAPGYHYAKTIIKLINTVAEKVNNDPDIQDKLKVVFLENFNVSLAELIYPAADISEQISTASREASGTGNMKFMLNGAITLGTLDGANVEILEAVGREHIMIFGLTAEKVLEYQRHRAYHSWDDYHNYPRLRRVVDQLTNGFFKEANGEFRVIHDSLLRDNDEFFVLKDFCSYVEAFNRLQLLYANEKKWYQSATVNIAKAGIFSSDRSIREYAEGIWRIKI